MMEEPSQEEPHVPSSGVFLQGLIREGRKRWLVPSSTAFSPLLLTYRALLLGQAYSFLEQKTVVLTFHAGRGGHTNKCQVSRYQQSVVWNFLAILHFFFLWFAGM